jgi:mRNA-degrading endonuclease RelE of RelBE toxin-antitoxin system
MPFTLAATARFLSQADHLPDDVYRQLQKQIRLLAQNPRHPSLKTHAVKNAIGSSGAKIFEGYVNMHYRFTWEYGKNPSEIVLRNVDNHDECLENP